MPNCPSDRVECVPDSGESVPMLKFSNIALHNITLKACQLCEVQLRWEVQRNCVQGNTLVLAVTGSDSCCWLSQGMSYMVQQMYMQLLMHIDNCYSRHVTPRTDGHSAAWCIV